MTIPSRSTSFARRFTLFVIVGLLVMACAMVLDRVALDAIAYPSARLRDWHRLLRVMGYLPLWLIAALAILMVDHSSRPAGEARFMRAVRGLRLALSAATGGLGAEALKLLLRRERPSGSGGFTGYIFRSFSDGPLRAVNLGLPSSHAMVAFAGAFALARLFPSARIVWIMLALGCGLTRVIDHDHYPSDVALAALGGYAAAWAMAALIPDPTPRRPCTIPTRGEP